MLPAQALRAGGLWALKLIPSLRRQAFAIGMGAG
jgi:2-octaprenyl-6-methoxyphenol hydroxylase